MLDIGNKDLLVLYSPVDVFAGYGARARDLAYALIQLKEPEFAVRFISCSWGACPHGALDSRNPRDLAILERILPAGPLPKQPAVWMMCTVPNEMQKVGSHYNIMVTAGVETHICTPEFLEGANKADLVLTSSTFGKDVLLRSTYDRLQEGTKEKVGELKFTAKVDVLFEGLDLNIYHKLDKSDFNLDDIQEEFAFLSVGHWINGELFTDRKNIATMVKVFLETFKNRTTKCPALILKTSSGVPSVIDREFILDKIDVIRRGIKAHTLPNIYVISGNFTDVEMNALYAHPKVKAFVLLGNEGFGRPYLEFSVHQKPIIASNYSGHLDFLDKDYCVLVNGEVKQIHPSVVMKNIIPPNGAWFYVNASEASAAMKGVFENYKDYLEGAKRQAYKSRTEFSLEKMQKRLKEIFDQYVPKLSIPITLKLPVLKPRSELLKIETNETLQTIE